MKIRVTFDLELHVEPTEEELAMILTLESHHLLQLVSEYDKRGLVIAANVHAGLS